MEMEKKKSGSFKYLCLQFHENELLDKTMDNNVSNESIAGQ